MPLGTDRCKDENLSQSLYQRRLLGGEAKLMRYQLKHRREGVCDIALFSCRCCVCDAWPLVHWCGPVQG